MTQESSIGKFKRALIGQIDRIRVLFRVIYDITSDVDYSRRRLTYIYSHDKVNASNYKQHL